MLAMTTRRERADMAGDRRPGRWSRGRDWRRAANARFLQVVRTSPEPAAPIRCLLGISPVSALTVVVIWSCSRRVFQAKCQAACGKQAQQNR